MDPCPVESPMALSMFCVVLPDLFPSQPLHPLGVALHDPRSRLSHLHALCSLLDTAAALFSEMHEHKAAW